MTTVSEQRLAKIFVEVADTLVDEFDVIEFMQMRAHARRTNQRLGDVARAVVTNMHSPHELNGD
jgi:hypothetical protein